MPGEAAQRKRPLRRPQPGRSVLRGARKVAAVISTGVNIYKGVKTDVNSGNGWILQHCKTHIG